MACYGKMDVFKSFITHFTMHETDKQVSSYVSVKFWREKGEKQNCEISHIDPGVYKQIQNSLLHIRVCGVQSDLIYTIYVADQNWSAWTHYEGDLLEITSFETIRIFGFWILDFGRISDFGSDGLVRSVGRSRCMGRSQAMIDWWTPCN